MNTVKQIIMEVGTNWKAFKNDIEEGINNISWFLFGGINCNPKG